MDLHQAPHAAEGNYKFPRCTRSSILLFDFHFEFRIWDFEFPPKPWADVQLVRGRESKVVYAPVRIDCAPRQTSRDHRARGAQVSLASARPRTAHESLPVPQQLCPLFRT